MLRREGPGLSLCGSGGSRWQEEDKQDGFVVPKGVGTRDLLVPSQPADPRRSGGGWPAGCLFHLQGHFVAGFFLFAMEGEAGGRHFQAVFSRISQLRLTAGSHWAPDQRQSPARVGVGGSGGREPNNDEDEEEEG